MENNFSAIVLAGGKGKRMNSALPKVLHRIGKQTILERTIKILKSIKPTQLIIVCNQENKLSIQRLFGEQVDYATQAESRGTADAVSTAMKSKESLSDSIGVFYGDDTAFYKPQTINNVFLKHVQTGSTVTFITVIKADPTGLGRIIRNNSKVSAIVEEKDATPDQLKINEVNDGVYFLKKDWLFENISKIVPSKATGELYLTDLIKMALAQNQKVETFTLKDKSQWHGVNSAIELAEANLKVSKNIHFMGISGAGSAAVAGIAKGLGFKVSGCDLNDISPYTKNLKIPIKMGHSASHLKGISVLVVSPAILILDPKNPELEEARSRGMPVITWQQFQGQILQKGKFVIAVAGAYGKSTTTAMIAKILTNAGLDPTCEIGANVLEWGKNFRIGKSKYYVCEADEYFNNFLNYKPDIAVVLNTSWEHPDFFKTEADLKEAYQNFIKNIKYNGWLVISKESRTLASGSSAKITTAKDFKLRALAIIGEFRKENANFALTLAKVLNLDLKKSTQSVMSFKGLERRLERKGKIGKTIFYDDYAVQPYTIKTTANALAEKFTKKKLLLVLEPHMRSRLTRFFNEFVSALKSVNADNIYITDIFTAREKSESANLSTRLKESIGQKAKYTGSLINTAKLVAKNLKDYDVVLSMGAGDIYKLYDLAKAENG